MAGTIYEEVLEAAKTVGSLPPANRDRDEYVLSLATIIGTKISEKTWESLSQEAQAWYSLQAAPAANKGVPIPPLPGFDDVNQCPFPGCISKEFHGGDHDVKPVGTEVVASTTSGRIDSSAPNQANTPKHKTEVTGEAKPVSISATTRRIVIEHMDWTNEQIKTELIKLGNLEANLKMSSISTLRTDTLASMKIAQELGWKKA